MLWMKFVTLPCHLLWPSVTSWFVITMKNSSICWCQNLSIQTKSANFWPCVHKGWLIFFLSNVWIWEKMVHCDSKSSKIKPDNKTSSYASKERKNFRSDISLFRRLSPLVVVAENPFSKHTCAFCQCYTHLMDCWVIDRDAELVWKVLPISNDASTRPKTFCQCMGLTKKITFVGFWPYFYWFWHGASFNFTVLRSVLLLTEDYFLSAQKSHLSK